MVILLVLSITTSIMSVLNRHQNKPKNPTTTFPKKDTILVLPYLGVQSKIVTKQFKTCINKFYGCIDVRVIFQSARRIKSFLPYKDMINRSQMSKVVYKAGCWDCQNFYIGKTKRRLHDRKTEHFNGITSTCHASPIADHVTSTGVNLKWDHFEILAKGRSDTRCKIKETLLIQELKPTLHDTVSSERLYLYYFVFFTANFLSFCHCYC